MSRPIDADALFYKLCNTDPNTKSSFCDGIAKAMEFILNAPTIGAVHGRWMLEREPDGKPYCLHCSVCGPDYHYIGIIVAYDYCPNCGAKMDLEVDDDG